MFQNSCLGCLYVHSSTTPNRVFLKPPFEGVTGHPLQVAVNHSKGCYSNTYTLLILNCMSWRVIFLFMKYLTIPDSVAKKKNHIIIKLCCYKRRKDSPYIFLDIDSN